MSGIPYATVLTAIIFVLCIARSDPSWSWPRRWSGSTGRATRSGPPAACLGHPRGSLDNVLRPTSSTRRGPAVVADLRRRDRWARGLWDHRPLRGSDGAGGDLPVAGIVDCRIDREASDTAGTPAPVAAADPAQLEASGGATGERHAIRGARRDRRPFIPSDARMLRAICVISRLAWGACRWQAAWSTSRCRYTAAPSTSTAPGTRRWAACRMRVSRSRRRSQPRDSFAAQRTE